MSSSQLERIFIQRLVIIVIIVTKLSFEKFVLSICYVRLSKTKMKETLYTIFLLDLTSPLTLVSLLSN